MGEADRGRIPVELRGAINYARKGPPPIDSFFEELFHKSLVHIFDLYRIRILASQLYPLPRRTLNPICNFDYGSYPPS